MKTLLHLAMLLTASFPIIYAVSSAADRPSKETTNDSAAVHTAPGQVRGREPDAGDNLASEAVDDASITSEVRYALLSHWSTRAVKTGIETKAGVVLLTGEARTATEKSLVGKFAGEVIGVKSVSNRMTVRA